MSTKIISALYNGNYGYLVEEATKDIRYKENLRKIIDEKDFDSFINLIEANTELNHVEMELAFVGGFSLAVHLFMEAFYQDL